MKPSRTFKLKRHIFPPYQVKTRMIGNKLFYYLDKF